MTEEEAKKRLTMSRDMARDLRKYKYMLGHSFLQAGRILWEFRKEGLFRDLGCKSFREFLADPEYGMPMSTAYLYLNLYGYYIVDQQLPEEDVIDIGIDRLRSIVPILKSGGDRDEWLAKARVLGKGDFYQEVAEATGKKAADILQAMPDEDEVCVMDTTYVQIVKGSPCCVCGARPVDPHHFTRTSGAGGLGTKVIPLCRGCHIAFHNAPKDFFWHNRHKIVDYFYELIDILIKEGSNGEDTDVPDIPVSEVQETDVEPE